MDNAAFEAEINEHIQKLQDLNKQMIGVSDKIGVLQEEGRALHGAALEVKGAIEALAKMKTKQDERLAKSKTAGLTLPEGVTPFVLEPAAPAVSPDTSTPPAEPLVNADGTVPLAVAPEDPAPEPTSADRLADTTDVQPTTEMPLSGGTVPSGESIALEVQ